MSAFCQSSLHTLVFGAALHLCGGKWRLTSGFENMLGLPEALSFIYEAPRCRGGFLSTSLSDFELDET